jgi:23S rRNA (cytosine1962-C5)-methyltransferase
MQKIILKRDRERSLLRRHPWVFSGAIDKVQGAPQLGDSVSVYANDGRFLGHGAWNPVSNIRVRIWAWREDVVVDAAFFAARLAAAIAMRERLLPTAPDGGVRLVHGESDGLPGLVVDRFGEVLVMQATSAGARRWREVIADALMSLTGARALYERSDSDVLEVEGLDAASGLLRGTLADTRITCIENGLAVEVDLAHGHKTGHYLDQRENRALVGALAADAEVLDAFCYSGGFALQALKAGARHVTAIDSSAAALAQVQRHLALNALPAERCTLLEDDVFKQLRKLRDQNRHFDVIVLDPPKFAPTAATAERAARGYKDINLLALKLLRPGGVLATFSCSGGVSADLFRKIVAGAAQDAGVDAQLLRQLHATPDHPIALAFPEGEYLKGLLLRVS